MKRIYPFSLLVLCILLLSFSGCYHEKSMGLPASFNNDWFFIREDSLHEEECTPPVSGEWESVDLPHTAKIEPTTVTGDQWTGVCWYRKTFRADKKFKGRHVALLFDGAMNDAIVYLNGTELYHNTGGYLPFYVDLTNDLKNGKENEILVRLDNRDNKQIPPGKPLHELDFLYYSGLYRDVSLVIKNKLHITNAVEVDSLRGGGIMTGYANVSSDQADIITSTVIKNDDRTLRVFALHVTLLDAGGSKIAEARQENISLMPGVSSSLTTRMNVIKPALWSPESPFLYTLKTDIVENETIIDSDEQRIGIRDLKISAENGLVINGKKIKIRGTNRHQEYPGIGYALSDNASYRDAYKIKEAGFNFVRCSHYPQSPAFLDACDELGIMVMDAIPGWQYMGDSIFRNAVIHDTRLMCRRDRNHPSIILWESSLNETWMPYRFLSELNRTTHEELNMLQCYTCSWMDTICDVFIPARQHAKAPDYWNNYNKKKALFICEYGDWEYYANNAGFSQSEFRDLSPALRNSRQLRSAGERGLLQQAYNFQEAHNSNLCGPAIGDANWLMYDYNRGYAPDIESSGIMDIFRLPKFAYWFYRSQSDRSPVCFIAYYNTPESGKLVRVFSNADTVILTGDDKLIARQSPDVNQNTINLSHPPFTFTLKEHYNKITATGIKNGEEISSSSVTKASSPAAIRLSADFSNRPLAADGADAVFVYASIVDSTENTVYAASDSVMFTIKGDAVIMGQNTVKAEAGIAPVIIRAGTNPGKIIIRANAKGLSQAEMMIESK
nr:glycoside hydrolase family 2 TIM barrel-domain containing protein [Bacteroidales bacterium]